MYGEISLRVSTGVRWKKHGMRMTSLRTLHRLEQTNYIAQSLETQPKKVVIENLVIIYGADRNQAKQMYDEIAGYKQTSWMGFLKELFNWLLTGKN